MKRFTVVALLFGLALLFTPVVQAQQSVPAQQSTEVAPGSATQVVPGTQVRLTLLNGLSTKVAHDGDPFTAAVADPVYSGNQLLLPAGAIIHGTVSGITKPRMFSMFRQGASMNIAFSSIEVESRIFPAKMSIISISAPGDTDKTRKDIKTTEGEVVSENHDIKNDVLTVAIGTAGGSTVGLLFSHVMRGTIYGLVGSGAYIAIRKGKDVDLPAQTKVLVRMDSSLSLPPAVLHTAANTSNGAQ
jgi:hypothetical protein